MRKLIQNGECFLAGQNFLKADIVVEDGLIAQIIEKSNMEQAFAGVDENGGCDVADYDEVIDAAGFFVVPGFIDVHLHGAAGYDFCRAESSDIEKIISYERSVGVTGICPATMTLSEEDLLKVFDRLGRAAAENPAAILGLHMEGPFISPKKAGAQAACYIQKANDKLMNTLYDRSGRTVKLVTVAPEEAPAEFISKWKDKVHISLGHTDADYDRASAAFSAGADHVTHLYNAMPVPTHREPSVKGAAFDNMHVFVEMICDLQHIHPSVIRETFALFGEERIVMISDSCEATGMPDGEYELGGRKIYKKASTATLADGTLAGSVCTLYDCFRKALAIGIPPKAALRACTCNPAASIGLGDKVGIISKGAAGNLLLLDENWNLLKVLS